MNTKIGVKILPISIGLLMALIAACSSDEPTPGAQTTIHKATATVSAAPTAKSSPTTTEAVIKSPTDTPLPTRTSTPLPEEEQTIFQPIPVMNVGERFFITLINNRQNVEDGEITLDVTSHTPIQVNIVSKTDRGYILSWEYGQSILEDVPSSVESFVEDFANLISGWKVEYEVEESGRIIELVKSDQIDGFLSDEIQTDGILPEDIQLFHIVYGWPPFEPGTSLTYEESTPNPFGGEPIPSTGKLEVTEFSPASNQLTIHWTKSMDQELYRQFMLDFLTEMAKEMGTDPPTDADLPIFKIEDSGEIHIDINTGWITSAEFIKKIEAGSDTNAKIRIDTTKMVTNFEDQ